MNILIYEIFENDIKLSKRLSDPTYILSIADLVAISVETPRIDSKCFLEKEFIELINMNP